MSLVPLEHKAAGHDGSLQSSDGTMFIKPTVAQECEFYNQTETLIQSTDEDIALGSRLFHWMPTYIGTMVPGISKQLEEKQPEMAQEFIADAGQSALNHTESSDRLYIVLENVCHGFKNPSVLDIKLGDILYDESASEEKVKRMQKVSRETTSGSLGFRICGLKIPDMGKPVPVVSGINMEEVSEKTQDGYMVINKLFGRRLTTESVKNGLEVFFRYNGLPQELQDQVIEKFLLRLQLLYNCLLDEEVRIISGSLLFVIENDLDRWKEQDYVDPVIKESDLIDEEDEEDEEEEENQESALSLLKMIDFAHAKYTPGKGYDEGLVKGVESLIGIFEQLTR